MNFKKLSYVFFLLVLVSFAACENSSNDATLKVTSTVKGVTVTSLGTPNSTLADEVAGAVTITAAEASGTSNTGNFITLFSPTNSGATVKIVKYATGGDTTNFATDTVYVNQAITTLDFFIIKVTAQDATTVLYYNVVVTVVSNIATVTSTAYTVSVGGTANETIIGVPKGTSKTTFEAALTNGDSNQTWNDTGIHNPVVSGDTLVVTAQDGATVVTYTITANLYALRDTGPAGGLISYVDPVNAKLFPSGITYLEVAPVSTEFAAKKWSDPNTTLIGTNIGIGTGQANTTAILPIISGESDRAAQLCDALVSGTKSDWFLPSKGELNKIWVNLASGGPDDNSVTYTPVSGFGHGYWSSSEDGGSNAWWQYLYGSGSQNSNAKSVSPGNVRCVRAF